MDDETGISTKEFTQLSYEHLNRYIKLANQKASILLTAQLAYIAIFANTLSQVQISQDITVQVLGIGTVVIAAGAAYFAARTVYPDTPDKEDGGLMLWGSILEYERDGYKQRIIGDDSGDLLSELLDENYQLAKVAHKKYDRLRNSLLLTGAMVFSSIILGGYIIYLS